MTSLFEQVDVSKTQHDMGYGMSNDKISSVTEFERPFIKYTNASIKLKFDESILKQKLSTSLGLIANYYIVYILSPRTHSCNIGLYDIDYNAIKNDETHDIQRYLMENNNIK